MAFKYEKRGYEPEVLKRLQQAQLEILRDFDAVCEKHNLPYFVVYGTAIGAVRHQGFIPWDDDTDVAMLRKDYEKFLEIVPREMGDKYKILTPEIDKNYACNVTHLQRKGTKFVAEFSKDMKCDLCIDLDIFPLDNLAPKKKQAKHQAMAAMFYGKLLFLCGTPHPVINLSGIKGILAEKACVMIHYGLKMLHISPRFLYRKFEKAATKYNRIETRYVTTFEGMNPLKKKLKKAEIFPLKKVPFEDMEVYLPNNNHEFLTSVYGDYMQVPPVEKQINHIPYILQFENEEPIIVNGKMRKN
jgi:lipopolysaccharide cholinephosphotransferase